MIIIQNGYGEIIMSNFNSVEQAMEIAGKISRGETTYPAAEKRQHPYMVYECDLKGVVCEDESPVLVDFECAARKQGTAGGNEPADCNWPMCGCDPCAEKVIDALIESGILNSH
jgi:hypothetical protein